ncbi:MAG: type IV toxin-antitoxin system AbiEi family antitoxin domain-containing protein [Actinobacteria bacterium]|nr:type IV toxin-antitoxin system AbiEi family antitoxin domain-containing protein [Actinomycetota bacterium]
MDERIYEFTRRQHSLVTREQLLSLGLTDRQVDYLLQSGRLRRFHRGVYVLPGVAASWHQRLMAACLAVGAGAAVSHRAAAALWGLDGPFRGLIEVAGERLDETRPKGVITHRSTDLGPAYVTERLGIPVTSPARTLLDLGAVTSQAVLDRALDDALARGLAEWEDLLAVLAELARRGRRGVGKLRRSLAERTGVPESVLEAEFQRLIRRFNLPEPVYQYELFDESGEFVARIDAAYPALRLAVELDGASTRVGRHALFYDTDRQNRIVAQGFLPIRYTWKAIVGLPEKTASELQRAIGRRRSELGVATAA